MSTYSDLKGGVETTVYSTAADLPLTDVSGGAQAYVTETNRLYLWNGSGWYNIALINTAPTITTEAAGSYTLATDGTATVITLVATDPEGVPITWSHAVTTGSIGSAAVVTQSANVFTVTPSSTAAHAGTFSLTFTASDGINVATSTSAFTLSFGFSGTQTYKLYNPTPSSSDKFAVVTAVSSDYIVTSAYNILNAEKVYIYDRADASLLYTITLSYRSSGQTLSIDGDILVVGGTPSGYSLSGKVFVYDISTFSSTAISSPNYTLVNPDPDNYYDQFDAFGLHGLAVSGDYIAVSAATAGHSSTTGDTYSGETYVYKISTFSTSTPSPWRTLLNPNAVGTATQDQFGQTIALEGNNLLVGTTMEDSPHETAGIVYYYDISTWGSGNPTPTYTVANPNADGTTNTSDYFSVSLVISGSKWAAAATYEDENGTSSGSVYIFNVSGGALVHRIDGPSTYPRYLFGRSLALDGNNLISSSSDSNTGQEKWLHRYDISALSGSTTTATTSDSGTITNPGAADNQWPGRITFKDDMLVTGAQYDDNTNASGGTHSNSGVVYVFE